MSVALLTFLAAATLIIVAPGPDTLLVTRNGVPPGPTGRSGHRGGHGDGLALWSVAAALGLSGLLAASRIGYDVVRVAGGLYLICSASRACAHTAPCPPRRRRRADADAPRVPQWGAAQPAGFQNAAHATAQRQLMIASGRT